MEMVFISPILFARFLILTNKRIMSTVKQMNATLRLGSRASKLALWQTEYINGLLQNAYPDVEFEVETITSRGDKILDTPLPLIGGKGLFTAELETNLSSGKIDLAVHSLKDLPTELSNSLLIGAVPERASAQDVLISKKGYTFANLPKGASLGTSSLRRSSQVLYRRPDLQIKDIRGNVETRIRKALEPDGMYDAVIMAYAGLDRLGLNDVITEILSFDLMLPAPGQGALGVQCRNEESIVSMLQIINDPQTEMATTAERSFLIGLGGGCSLPIAAYAHFENDKLSLHCRVVAQDGSTCIDLSDTQVVQSMDEAFKIGIELAQEANTRGAHKLLKIES